MPSRPSAPARPTPLDEAGLRSRLRELRTERTWSIGELSKRSGVPVSTISKIENGQLNASLVHAINLASALEVNLGFLADSTRTRHARYSIVRRSQRGRRDFPEMALVLEDLNIGFVPGLLEARIGTIGTGANSGAEYMRHPGEELAHVLSGNLTYDIDGQNFELSEGDSLHFKAETPHRWQNAGGKPAVLVWIFSDGLSF